MAVYPTTSCKTWVLLEQQKNANVWGWGDIKLGPPSILWATEGMLAPFRWQEEKDKATESGELTKSDDARIIVVFLSHEGRTEIHNEFFSQLEQTPKPRRIWCHYGGALAMHEAQQKWDSWHVLDEVQRERLMGLCEGATDGVSGKRHPVPFSEKQRGQLAEDEMDRVKTAYQNKHKGFFNRALIALNNAWLKAGEQFGIETDIALLHRHASFYLSLYCVMDPYFPQSPAVSQQTDDKKDKSLETTNNSKDDQWPETKLDYLVPTPDGRWIAKLVNDLQYYGLGVSGNASTSLNRSDKVFPSSPKASRLREPKTQEEMSLTELQMEAAKEAESVINSHVANPDALQRTIHHAWLAFTRFLKAYQTRSKRLSDLMESPR